MWLLIHENDFTSLLKSQNQSFIPEKKIKKNKPNQIMNRNL